MLAAIFHGVGDVRLEERPLPEPTGASDVRFRVLGTGVCGTDRNIIKGLFPAKPGTILGHEAIGVVDAVGPGVTSLVPGDEVIANPTLYCGRCNACRVGKLGLCERKAGTEVGVDRDGTFAEYAILPEQFLYKLPAGLPHSKAVLVEPLACVLNNAGAARLGAADRVLVIGGGPIGILWAMVAKRWARSVTLVEPSAYRREIASKWVTSVDLPPEQGVREWASAICDGAPDVVVDTTGTMLECAVEAVASGGRVVLMGFNTEYRATIPCQAIVSRAISIIGAGDYNSQILPTAIDLISELPVEGLITHQFPLSEINRGLAVLGVPNNGHPASADYAALKVLIT